MTRPRRAAPAAVALGLLLVTSACGEGPPTDKLQVVENPTAVTAPRSPAITAEPRGSVVGAAEAGRVAELGTDRESRTLVAAVSDPPAALLYDLDEPAAEPTRVALPGTAGELTIANGTALVPIPGADVLARISLPDGALDTVPVPGGPAGVTVDDSGRTLVALRERKGVAVVRNGRVTNTFDGGLYSADDIVLADGRPFVLDRRRTALFTVDPDAGDFGGGLRAGHGAANTAVDSFGRLLVTDTRGGGLLAFSSDPFLLRQRYPVPGGVYGLAYDPRTGIAWVTLTKRNEVVGFDMRGGEPTERYRYSTVRQPNSVTVDPRTSRVIVGSAAGEGIQVIAP